MSWDEADIEGSKETHGFLHESSEKIFRVALFKVIIELTFLNLVFFCECIAGFSRKNPLSKF